MAASYSSFRSPDASPISTSRMYGTRRSYGARSPTSESQRQPVGCATLPFGRQTGLRETDGKT
jgi:hypothetical protein